MKTLQLWSEIIPKPSDPNSTLTNQVFCTAINNEGTTTVAVVGDAILLYDSNTGDMLNKPIRGAHKEQINFCTFSKDGKRFSTCSNDKSVIIWQYSPTGNPKVTAELKYTHNEAVYCLSFNPLTSQIFSGGTADYAVWTPGLPNIEKKKSKEKINCCMWSSDGMYVAHGLMSGQIILMNRNLEETGTIVRSAPIWCMDWTPISPENQDCQLVVGCWDQTITFYNVKCQQLGASKVFNFDPLSIQFFSNGEFYLLTGTNKKACLYAREGGFLTEICEQKDWIWSARLRQKDMFCSVTTNNGFIGQYQIVPLSVHGLSADKYAQREGLTDIVVQSLTGNQKVRIKCKELVKSVSLYKDKLAAQLNEKLVIYAQSVTDENALKFRLLQRINKSFDAQHFIMLTTNILLGYKRKMQIIKLNGELEKEWVLESTINYIKNIGGPSKKEMVLVGLKNGNVLKVFINNSFPIVLVQHSIPIVVCDLSLDKKKLAIVDQNNNLTIIDTVTKETLLNEMNVTSCCWNKDFNDMIAYSGQDMLFIKASNHQPLVQKMQGQVVGFKENKLFILHEHQLNTIDVSQTSTMLKYIEKKDFQSAFSVACMGKLAQDFKILGAEALINQQFDIAKKCFQRVHDSGFLHLIKKYQHMKENGNINEVHLQADVLAYQNKFHEAAQLYNKSGEFDKAVELFTELKRFDEAKKYSGGSRPITSSSSNSRKLPSRGNAKDLLNIGGQAFVSDQVKKLIKEEADWKNKMGNWKESAELYLQSQDYKKAIEAYASHDYLEGLIDVCRQIDAQQNSAELQLCAFHFRKHKHHAFAKEAYLKLNDNKSLMAMHIEMEKWEEALLLGKQNATLLEMVKLPYAEHLCRIDHFEEALRAFKSLGRYDLTIKLLNTLTKNAVVECRFEDAAYYYHVLSIESLKLIQNGREPIGQDLEYMAKYQEQKDTAEIYYAYNKIYQFIEEPFQPLSGTAYLLQIFNAAKFVLSKIGSQQIYGVKFNYLLYALGKVSKSLGAYKTARYCYEKIQNYKIFPEWTEEVELSNLLIRSKPFSDPENLLPICNRCMNSNQTVSVKNRCASCMHPFVCSFISFDNLPLVEFKVDPKINHRKVIELLHSDKSNRKYSKKKKQVDDGWSESHTENQNVLNFAASMGEDFENTPFFEKLSEIFEMQQTSNEYIPITLDEDLVRSLEPDEVCYVDLTKYCPTMDIKYYKSMVQDIPAKVCNECGKFFLLDEYEFECLKTKKCPFCKSIDAREGPQKDVFEV